MESLIIQTRKQPAVVGLQKLLLICGVLSSVLYVVANVITAMQYPGYNTSSQTVSELSAIDTPTRSLWVLLMAGYSLLVIAFAIGVWRSAGDNRRLQVVAGVLIAYAVIGFFWPPMHQREVLAAGGGTLTDTLHIVFTFITVPLLMLAIGFGSTAFGNGFRFYSIATLVILFIAGMLTGIDSPRMEANLPTPWIGVWERISIGVYMLWVVVFAIKLLRSKTFGQSINVNLLRV